MSLKSVILGLVLFEVSTKCFVEGLQCYVCEDCNEYKDFKELHICGEIFIETTIKPVSIPEIMGNNAANLSTKKPSKPSSKPSIDDYLYEDSDETHVDVIIQNSDQKKTTKAATTKTTNSIESEITTKPTTPKPNSVAEKSMTGKPAAEERTTTQPFIKKSNTESIAITSSTGTIKPKPVLATDYDDYLEYEDSIKTDTRSIKSLLKINDPVCYMIKYQVNNTVSTNRGCTTFINSNKFLTCQSLNNGAPMESCRVCSTNGCNKFLDDISAEHDHGISFNVANVPEHFGVVVLILLVLLNRSII